MRGGVDGASGGVRGEVDCGYGRRSWGRRQEVVGKEGREGMIQIILSVRFEWLKKRMLSSDLNH